MFFVDCQLTVTVMLQTSPGFLTIQTRGFIENVTLLLFSVFATAAKDTAQKKRKIDQRLQRIF